MSLKWQHVSVSAQAELRPCSSRNGRAQRQPHLICFDLSSWDLNPSSYKEEDSPGIEGQRHPQQDDS